MVTALESVTTFVSNLVTQLGGRKKRTEEQDCAWLDDILDDLIEIAADTSKKSEIVSFAALITSAEIDSCTAEELQILKEDVLELESIVCDLKEEMGEPCTTIIPSTVGTITTTGPSHITTISIQHTFTGNNQSALSF